MAEFVVRAGLNDSPLVEHVDPVRILHRREPVRNDHDRHLPLQRVNTALDVVRWERSDRVVLDCWEALSRSLVASSSSSFDRPKRLRPPKRVAANRPHECQRSSIPLCMLAYRFEKLFRERVKVLSFRFRRLAFKKQPSLPRIAGIDVELIQTVQHIEVNVNLG